MKIAVIGKGGSGKTTTSSVLARTLARDGQRVIALDCDANANLGLSLGMGVEAAEELASMRERLEAGEEEHAPTMQELLDRFGSTGPDGLRFAVVAKVENPHTGCPCCGLSPDALLAGLDAPETVVIADLEAGIGTLSRIEAGSVDFAVLIAEPTAKSLDVARRALGLAREKGIENVVVVANRVESDADLQMISDSFPDTEVVVVPEDRAITDADRQGVAPYDLSPDAPAVMALMSLARRVGAVRPAA